MAMNQSGFILLPGKRIEIELQHDVPVLKGPPGREDAKIVQLGSVPADQTVHSVFCLLDLGRDIMRHCQTKERPIELLMVEVFRIAFFAIPAPWSLQLHGMASHGFYQEPSGTGFALSSATEIAARAQGEAEPGRYHPLLLTEGSLSTFSSLLLLYALHGGESVVYTGIAHIFNLGRNVRKYWNC
jgi:hypothetical protein